MIVVDKPTQMTPKRPDETVDYDFQWAKRLDPDNDTIVDGIVTCNDPSLILGSTVVDTKTVKQWTSGGTDGVTYTLVNTIHTTLGRTLVRIMYVKVKA